MEEVFWNLFSNRFMPGFNYIRHFSFKTVFYYSLQSYCLCECGFEHEYLDCILENGEVDKELYEKTLKNIANGKCPHVDKVDRSFVKETSISALHIAAAVGTEQAIIDSKNRIPIYSGLFNLDPFQLAVLKQNIKIVSLYKQLDNYRRNIFRDIIFSHKSVVPKASLKVNVVSTTVFSIRQGNRPLLRAILDLPVWFTDIYMAFEEAFRKKSIGMQEDLLKFIKQSMTYSLFAFQESAVSAIVYDQPRILHELVEVINSASDNECLAFLAEVCNLLGRSDCASLIRHLHTLSHSELLEPRKYRLRTLSLLNGDFGDYTEEISTKLKSSYQIIQDVNIRNEIGETRLHKSVILSNNEVKFLLENGADVDSMTVAGNTPLLCLLSKRNYIPDVNKVRVTTELLLSENPSVSLNKSAVELAIDFDEYLEKTTLRHIRDHIRDGELLLDNKKHSLLGMEYDVNCSLTYFGPLLIESEFPVTKTVLYKALEKSLPSAENEYFHLCLSSPRSLKLSCRDVIRNYFERRKLHSFVENTDIPNQVKDFILLKDILLTQMYVR